MGERKVLNKYYPPDFDPAKIPKRKQLKNLQMKVRMMLPMSIRCNTCGTYMYKGTKFNCRKEDVQGETYLGLMKFRFYFKCTKCSAELAMKTDPKNSDYEMEFGASRNFEPWREADEVKEAARKQREEEEMGDAMKALENRTLDSKMEMDILAGLDEVKSLRARQAQVDQDALLQALKRSAGGGQQQELSEQELAEEDEKLIKSIVFQNSQNFVRRIDSDDEDEEEAEEEEEQGQGSAFPAETKPAGASSGKGKASLLGSEGFDGHSSLQNGSLSAPNKRHKLLHRDGEAEPFEKKAASSSRDSKPPPDALVIKKPDEVRPIFSVKPVKFAFAVKEKKSLPAVGPTSKAVPATGQGQSAVSLLKDDSTMSGHTAADAAQAAQVRTQPNAQQAEAIGLSLLSANYDDSDEGSE